MNFNRGKQMIIHDPRLNTGGANPKPLTPPLGAMNTWTVSRGDSVEHILDHAGAVAAAVGKLDALHIMAHGAKGFVQLGADNITWNNIELFLKLTDKVRTIVFFSCSVGSDETRDDSSAALASVIAQITNAKVLVCRETQYYNFPIQQNGAPVPALTFGDFEGEVYLYRPNGGHLVVFKDSRTGKASINLETYIFH